MLDLVCFTRSNISPSLIYFSTWFTGVTQKNIIKICDISPILLHLFIHDRCSKKKKNNKMLTVCRSRWRRGGGAA